MAVADVIPSTLTGNTSGSFKTGKQLLLAKGLFCVDISVLISVTVGYVASSVVERVDTSLTTSHMDTGCVD